ncbi:hypothetical protein ABVT39_027846 [Epinephelus coioides]
MKMESVLTKVVSGKVSTCGTIILMFTYTILLDRDFACTCKSQDFDCILYMALPCFIILVLMLWTDRWFRSVCRYLCSRPRSRCLQPCAFWGSFFHRIFRAFLVGLLWVAFVYIDGDWFVCCQNDGSEQQQHLACKAVIKITETEQVDIAQLKNKSREIGGWLLCAIVLAASLMPFCVQRKCCEDSCCDNRRFLYHKLILKEEETVLKEVLRKSAKEKLTTGVEDRIRSGQWLECFDVAGELIEVSTDPTLCDTREPETQLMKQFKLINTRNIRSIIDSNRECESSRNRPSQ